MKGFWHTLEAAVGVIIILSFLFLLTSNPQYQSEDLKTKAMELLRDADNRGILRTYAISKNWSGLNSNIRYYTYNHTIEICDFNRCYGILPNASNVWVGSYIISGKDDYNPLLIKLYIYR